MKAAIHTRYGPPEVVAVKDIDKPSPAADEILVKVYATTVNRTDCGFRSAQYFVSRFFSGLFKPNFQTLGNEFAGVVEAAGTDVKLFSVGDRVFGYNDYRFGGHAQYLTIREKDAVLQMPGGMSFEEAAPLTEGSHYALNYLRATKLGPGHQLLINGATGAIGSAAVQLAKVLGVTVTAVCNTRNVELVRSLGADTVIDYMKDDFTKIQQQFDVVFDAVGKSSFNSCKPLLKKKGVYVSTELGKNSQNVFLALATPVFGGKRVMFPIPTISRKDLEYIRTLTMEGKFRAVVDRKYTLDQIVDAYRYVETGQKTGNVVIVVSEEDSL